MLYNFAAHTGASTQKDDTALSPFRDRGSISAYAVNAMAWAVTNGIMSGTSATTISPTGLATRAQAAVMLMWLDQLRQGYLSDAAQEGNQYAQYTLGKLYLTGKDVARDREQAYRWFWESASQGNEYAQFFLDHFNDNHSPNVLLSATKLLHHMGRIFQDNSIPPCPPGQSQNRP